MKPITRNLILGLLLGVTVLAAALASLTLFFSSTAGQQWLGGLVLAAPDVSVSSLGQADYAWTLRDLDGRAVHFSEFEGRTVFLNIWATWCGPCIMELPAIDRLRHEMRTTDVAFVLVSREDLSVVQGFAEDDASGLPFYVAERLPTMFEGNSVPATFVIDPRGKVVFHHRGAARWDDDGVRDLLARLSTGDV